MIWRFHTSSAYKKRVKQRNLVGLDLHIASQDISLSSFHDGGSFFLCKSVEDSGKLQEP